MSEKVCSMCGGTFDENDCQSICSKCYNEFFYANYPYEEGVKGSYYWPVGGESDPTDI